MKTKKLFTPRDFIDVEGKDIYESADYFQVFIDQMDNERANAFDITTTTPTGSKVKVVDKYSGKELSAISFVSSNYLGMNMHPKVKEAAKCAIDEYGVGTSTTPLIGGYLDIHAELEKKIAKMHGKEASLTYSSGFAANVGVAQFLLNKNDIAIVDTFIHASMYDGLANTNVKIFGHNDLKYLEMVLEKSKGNYRNMIVIVDGVYSQDGDLPRLKEICVLSRQYGAYIFLDDAHGVGVLGKNGYGTCSHFNLSDEVDVITGTLSKAIGAIGGYVAGSDQLIKYLRHLSRPSIFSASLPPSVAVSASKAIDVFSEEPQIIEKLWENTKYARKTLIENGFDLGRSESPIIPIMVRDDMKAKVIARKLLENGVYIIPATYPAVKLKDSRLRMNVSATHSQSDIDYFCEQLNCINKEMEFK
ncbi:aminotransferase class I/II-fold pyridoxal phosphate-dependent enzyme [Saccharicrinis fermentans]|uniref:Putative pyridoxal phosphate-dependent acyltransferase n=1 Tax=Saccharicrinis fermentans DSM 9555 = JCM 21142 TaxID=869213 RepID=W7YM25_9BACT|nr:aminotransferase class I/II-fold pyridoxal phosphate-dependent enzyme [Saccharicrinis fermentans]GAF05706.1 putative pyridoxal phosphate-dependent acyltransferase [Saccharicrinis fermentans DSM 9555 = JCM 21142]